MIISKNVVFQRLYFPNLWPLFRRHGKTTRNFCISIPDGAQIAIYSSQKTIKSPNIQKRQKCPKFRLSQPRTYKPLSCIQKSQIRAKKGQKRQISRYILPRMFNKNSFPNQKHPKIPPNTEPRTKIHKNTQKIPRPQKSTTKKISEKYTPKR